VGLPPVKDGASQHGALCADRAATEFRGYPPSAIDQLKEELGDKIVVQQSDWNCTLAACRTGVYRMVARIFCHAASNGEIDRIGAAAGTGHHQRTGYG